MDFMTNDSITKLSLISSTVGIILLYLSAASISPGVTPISEIDENYIGLKTKISGEVIKTQKHSDGHLFLKIRGKNYEKMRVPIFSQTHSKLKDRIELLDNIEVKGEVTEYRGELQIQPTNRKNITVVNSAPLRISKISKSEVGEIVKVRGYISKRNKKGDGSYSIILKNNDDEIKIHIPKKIASSPKLEMMQEGEMLKAAGPLELQENDIAITIRDIYNLNFDETS